MKVIRTHTERLEKVINQGVELRHEMRAKTETKSQIIAAQRETILNQSRMINELEAENKSLKQENEDKRQQRLILNAEKKLSKQLKVASYKLELRKMNLINDHLTDVIAKLTGVKP